MFGFPDDFQWRNRLTQLELHAMHLAIPVDGETQALGERVHHRDTHPVQAARDLVGIIIEFSAGMQHRHNHLGR